MPNTTVTVRLDRPELRRVAEEAASEIARTLAFETLEVSTEEITRMGAVDTGNLRDTGYVETGGGERKGGSGSASVVWVPEGPGEAKVAYGAEYGEAVHEGYGSNAGYGPRAFLAVAAKDVAARAQRIAQDIVDRKYGG